MSSSTPTYTATLASKLNRSTRVYDWLFLKPLIINLVFKFKIVLQFIDNESTKFNKLLMIYWKTEKQ